MCALLLGSHADHTWDDAPSAPLPHHTYGSDRLNPACWPDPKAMMAELAAAAPTPVEAMISPYYNFIGRETARYKAAAASAADQLALDADGRPTLGIGGNETAMWDVFSDAGRREMMAGVLSGYVQPFGLRHFWLDCDEPCQAGIPASYNGMPTAAVGAAYPGMLARATREALGWETGRPSVMLGRSAWLGSQKYGTGERPRARKLNTSIPAPVLSPSLVLPVWYWYCTATIDLFVVMQRSGLAIPTARGRLFVSKSGRDSMLQ